MRLLYKATLELCMLEPPQHYQEEEEEEQG
jgi:hypothetical protein